MGKRGHISGPPSAFSGIARLATTLCLFGLSVCASAAPAPVSFSRQILPFFQSQCLGCHSGANPASGYSLETRERILAGGRHGVAVIPGKGASSALVRYLTGDLKPKMPPGGAVDMDKVALVRRWIDEGAKIDALTVPTSISSAHGTALAPKSNARLSPAPVTALAFSPDGKLLAVGGYRSVRLLDPTTGHVKQTWHGPADQVQSVDWSSDGKYLAAGGGAPGQSGEVVLFDSGTGKIVRTLTGPADVVYAVAWKHGSAELATGSLDKTVCIWDTNTGRCTRTLKDHADAVLCVAYSPDGKYLATGSMDRSVKLFETVGWKRVAILTAHQDAVTHLAFNPGGNLLAVASADKQIHIWRVDPGKMENPLHTQSTDDSINACAFSPDGNLLAWGASNRLVKVFNGDGSNQKREMRDPQDWVYAVAVGQDNRTVVAGTGDGKVLFWDVSSDKLILQVTLLPGGAQIEAGTDPKK